MTFVRHFDASWLGIFFYLPGERVLHIWKEKRNRSKKNKNMGKKNKGIGHKMFVHGRFLQSRYLCWGKLIENDVECEGFCYIYMRIFRKWVRQDDETENARMEGKRMKSVFFLDKRDTWKWNDKREEGKRKAGKKKESVRRGGGEIRTGVKYEDCIAKLKE